MSVNLEGELNNYGILKNHLDEPAAHQKYHLFYNGDTHTTELVPQNDWETTANKIKDGEYVHEEAVMLCLGDLSDRLTQEMSSTHPSAKVAEAIYELMSSIITFAEEEFDEKNFNLKQESEKCMEIQERDYAITQLHKYDNILNYPPDASSSFEYIFNYFNTLSDIQGEELSATDEATKTLIQTIITGKLEEFKQKINDSIKDPQDKKNSPLAMLNSLANISEKIRHPMLQEGIEHFLHMAAFISSYHIHRGPITTVTQALHDMEMSRRNANQLEEFKPIFNFVTTSLRENNILGHLNHLEPPYNKLSKIWHQAVYLQMLCKFPRESLYTELTPEQALRGRIHKRVVNQRRGQEYGIQQVQKQGVNIDPSTLEKFSLDKKAERTEQLEALAAIKREQREHPERAVALEKEKNERFGPSEWEIVTRKKIIPLSKLSPPPPPEPSEETSSGSDGDNDNIIERSSSMIIKEDVEPQSEERKGEKKENNLSAIKKSFQNRKEPPKENS